jgi:hypothetical protein
MKENHLIGNILEEMEAHSVGRDRPQSQVELAKLAANMTRSSSAPPVVPKNVSKNTSHYEISQKTNYQKPISNQI